MLDARVTGPVLVRCDGGAVLGAGHVARTLPIAAALERRGVSVRFAGRFDGVASELLKGYETIEPAAGEPAGIPEDAAAAIVDSYSIDVDELERANAVRPVLAVRDDDVRPDVALILAYHVDARPGERVLAGPDYAPLDPRIVGARRGRRDTGRGLVVLGGGTAGAELLPSVVEAMLTETTLTVDVAGATALQETDRVHPLGPIPSLAARFGDYELAVCGAGVTKYEAACAGLPAVLVVVADNQARGAAAFERLGLARVIDGRRPVTVDEIRAAIAATDRVRAAQAGPRLVDGLGAMRVADALLATLGGEAPAPVQRLRPATLEDADLLRAWRNDPDVRGVSGTTHEITPAEHRAWLERVLADDDRDLFVAERDGEPVATVRFDREGREAEISVSVAAQWRGAGIGVQTLREATELELAAHPWLERVIACVREDNDRSARAFRRAGYADIDGASGWLRLAAGR